MGKFSRDVDIGTAKPGAAHITDAKVDYETPDLDTEAEVIAALNAANTTMNSILTAMETEGVIASS